MEKEKKLVACRHCGAEIAPNAKMCPQCGAANKKPFYKRPWFIALVVIVILAVVAGGNQGTRGDRAQGETATGGADTQKESQAPEIVYTACDVAQLMDDLEGNALKAAEKYEGQYVELTGRLNVIDSSGKYISIVRTDKSYAIVGVQCYIKTEDQKAAVMELEVGDTLVVKGKIKSVGEVLGYSLDIDEIRKA